MRSRAGEMFAEFIIGSLLMAWAFGLPVTIYVIRSTIKCVL